MKLPSLTTKYLSDYKPYPFDISKLDLHFILDAERTRVVAKSQFKAKSSGASMWLDGKNLTLEDIRINDVPLASDDFVIKENGIEILNPPTKGVLSITTTINPRGNTALSGLYMSRNFYCSQCEAEGFRAITYFPDRPDVLCCYTTRVTADRKTMPIILGNGNPQKDIHLEGTKHTVVWVDPHPKPSYLFALVAGSFDCVRDTFTTSSGRDVQLGIYTEPGRGKYAKWAMECLKKAMKWDEERYQRLYDLDVFNIVAVNDFNFGAMENKGLNIFNDKYLLVDELTATDRDYENVEAIVAHEYFHNWTGNRITCRDWFQLCLKEGLTVFREQQFTADQRGHDVMRVRDVHSLQIGQFPEDDGPLTHPVRPQNYVEINNFYTATVYDKGAELIHMLHTWMGEEAFQKGIQVYFDRHDGQAVTIEAFLDALADGSGIDATRFLPWYNFAGTPRITITTAHSDENWVWSVQRSRRKEGDNSSPAVDAGKKRDERILPLRYAIFSGETKKEHTSGLLMMDQDIATITCPRSGNDESKALFLSLNRGFSAPIIIESEQPFIDLARSETDAFKRWEAVQELKCQMVQAFVDKKDGCNSKGYEHGLAAITMILTSHDISDRMRALLLELPDQDILLPRLRPFNPHSLEKAFCDVRQAIAKDCEKILLQAYESVPRDKHYEPSAEQCGRRAWCFALLRYIDMTNNGIAQQEYTTAGNMTERLSALTFLAERPEHDSTMKALLAKFIHEPLVLDSINTIRARTRRDDTPQIIEAIYRDEHFERSNPNRLYALIGGLTRNLRHFHDADQWGYHLLQQIVTDNNPTNPQLSARFARIFAKWRDYAEPYRSRQRDALKAIVNLPGVSPEVAEIASKSLGSD